LALPDHSSAVETDFLSLSDEDLLRQCEVDTFRASGPGGQKRNKTSSAVRLRHRPTGLIAQAVESRSQHENRARSLRRLRATIALEWRRRLDLAAYSPSPEVRGLFEKSGPGRVGPRSDWYWPAVQQLFDLLLATGASVSGTAERLGITTGSLSRFLTSNPELLAAANSMRSRHGLRPLRPVS
jgi:hypothetical protein